MEHQNFKSYGVILIILAILFLIGIISYWKFSTWLIIDWIAVFVCGYIGINIYNKK
jgi:hypothetical protein